MESLEKMIIEQGSVELTNKDRSNVILMSYDNESNKHTLTINGKKIKSVKKFKAIIKYLEDEFKEDKINKSVV